MCTKNVISQDRVRELFAAGIDCGQVVAGECAALLQRDADDLRRMTACLGGGMMCGEVCGAFNAALMVIGLKYGHCRESDGEQKAIVMEKMQLFRERFAAKYPSPICRELLGRKIPEEMDKVVEEGKMMTLCPQICTDVLEILSEIL